MKQIRRTGIVFLCILALLTTVFAAPSGSYQDFPVFALHISDGKDKSTSLSAVYAEDEDGNACLVTSALVPTLMDFGFTAVLYDRDDVQYPVSLEKVQGGAAFFSCDVLEDHTPLKVASLKQSRRFVNGWYSG